LSKEPGEALLGEMNLISIFKETYTGFQCQDGWIKNMLSYQFLIEASKCLLASQDIPELCANVFLVDYLMY
jgi:hypothetical protein